MPSIQERGYPARPPRHGKYPRVQRPRHLLALLDVQVRHARLLIEISLFATICSEWSPYKLTLFQTEPSR